MCQDHGAVPVLVNTANFVNTSRILKKINVSCIAYFFHLGKYSFTLDIFCTHFLSDNLNAE